MKILHTSDLHLRAYGDERWQALIEVLKVGKKEGVECVIISGDLFDSMPAAESLRPKIRNLFTGNPFVILAIPGNHDFELFRRPNYFGEDLLPLAKDAETFELHSVVFWGLPYENLNQEEVLRELRRISRRVDSSKKNILLYHGELLDSFYSRQDFGDEGTGRYMPVRLANFFQMGFDYVLAGHFHRNYEVYKFPDGGYFVYSGSPVSITRREVGPRSVNIMEIGGKPMEYHVDTAYFHKLEIILDPFSREDPLEVIRREIKLCDTRAKIILKIGGFYSSGTSLEEKELVRSIDRILSGNVIEKRYEMRDLHRVLDDDLFISFRKKLDPMDFDHDEKKRIRNLVLRAFMEQI